MNALILSLAILAPTADAKAGIRPVGNDGKPLNLNFESGTLEHWSAEGGAFKDQPIKGDTVKPRRRDMASKHQGDYWIGGYERFGDKPTGTLTSVPFKVMHPWASFLVAGGPHPKHTFVELLDAATKKPFFSACSAGETESLQRVAVDLAKMQGKEIQIRLVDKHSGHWGHLNFDDFLFHDAKPVVAARPSPLAQDDYKYAGQQPEDAARNMTVPPGFRVDLFAGEPDVHQPIAFCFDDRGRLWVVEAFVYPKRVPGEGPMLPAADRKKGDKILIFEDTDGDGKFDKRTVFLEGLNLVSGIEYGFGGLWIGAAPYFCFIPILENDKPGEVKVLLDGWGYEDTHETLNSFVWGPDGWLYGCHGVFTHSNVGKPGAKAEDRQRINAGIWRYHPTKHAFEVFAHGTSNPWGLDYNQQGDFFAEACVIPHLWHIVQGGRYQRQAGAHFNPYTYDDIKTIAKHRHYLGATPHGGNNKSDSAGGGHAHSGLLCYQGGTWPKEYHGKLFMGNIHGHRINVDVVTPKGSGYEGDRNPDFLLTNDRYAIIVAMRAGPDGNVFFTDWSDKQVCHRNEVEIWDRTNGRIFKVSHKDAKPVKGLDLRKLSDEELVKLQVSDNEWMVRHARRILQERADAHRLDDARTTKIRGLLDALLRNETDARVRLRGLWALAAAGLLPPAGLQELGYKDTSEQVRAWAIRLLADRVIPSRSDYSKLANASGVAGGVLVVAQLKHAIEQSKGRPGPVEAAAIASVLARLAPAESDQIIPHFLPNLAANDDPNLPYLAWYALERQAEGDPYGTIKLAAESKLAVLLPFAARRVAATGTPEALAALVKHLGPDIVERVKPATQQLAILRGMAEGLKGQKVASPPTQWGEVFKALAKSESADVRSAALAVGVAFRDPAAGNALLDIVSDSKADAAVRGNALAALLDVGHDRLGGVLKELVKDPALRTAAIRGMARTGDDGVPATLVKEYPNLSAADRREVVTVLASRVKFGFALLHAIEKKAIPSADVPAETVRQLRNLNDETLNKRIAAVWGVVRDTPADRKALILEWRRRLANPQPEDLAAGRAHFNKTCAQCHTLYGVGGKVGPDITGSNRADAGYLLENMFDPSAVIPKEYAATKLELVDGRVITGIVKEETKTTLTVVTDRETLTIPLDDVAGRKVSADSMMPNDLTKQLKDAEIRDLIAYLRHAGQVPALATADTAKDFFNGKDLTGWDGDKTVWSVENGEIVGKTEKGLKANNFLKGPFDVKDFKLAVKVKLSPNEANSGIQIRSANVAGGEMKGPQCDIGKGWWGKIYEESGRGLLAKEGGEKFVKVGEWNDYAIEAVGPNIKIWINGEKVADLTDDKMSRRGLLGFQVHSGGPTEVRFKEIKLEVK